MNTRIAVVGAGSWGTTLANLLAEKHLSVALWCYEKDLAQRMQTTRINDLYLPGISLPQNLKITTDLDEAVTDAAFVVYVTPSQVTRQVLRQSVKSLSADVVVISASKGIENDSLQLLSQVFDNELPAGLKQRVVFISGPSFAREVSQHMPTAVVAAGYDPVAAEAVQQLFSTPVFRVYTHNDIVGVELGGAMKNVIALAAGVADGLGFGYNTRAALITRGLAEMTRMGVKLGANKETLAGLAGMGDLVLTCTGDLSRNRSVGMELGKGRSLEENYGRNEHGCRGGKTTLSAYQLAQKLRVECPYH